jgi:hypothetical protein
MDTCYKAATGGSLEIYNMSGNKVLSMSLSSELLYKINLNDLPTGIYSYRIVNGEYDIRCKEVDHCTLVMYANTHLTLKINKPL